MGNCKHGYPWGECTQCNFDELYASGLRKFVHGDCSCNQRMLKALEQIHSIAGDMLDEKRRRGPAREVCCMRNGLRGDEE